MSSVKITGNASGTGVFTLSSPNSNTDRALTLPDGAGEIVLTDGTTLAVDNANDKVGIGTASPTNGKLEVTHSSSTVPAGHFRNTSASGDSPSLTVQGGANNAAPNFSVLDYDGNTDFVVQGAGNVGIGATSIDRQLHIEGSRSNAYSSSDFDNTYNLVKIENPNTANNMATGIQFLVGSNGSASITTTRTGDGAAALCFGTRGGGNRAERMRIDDLGRALFFCTAEPATSVHGAGFTNNQGELRFGTSGTGNTTRVRFYNPNGEVGAIRTNGSATAYHTSSDYRIKQDVVDMTGAIDRLKTLSPKRFAFKADPSETVDGFLAHEVSPVVPIAVSGTKDEVETWTQQQIDDGSAPDGTSAGDNKLDEEGNTIPAVQGLDHSKLVPLLVGALQEAITKIETLETKVAALEAK